ncbi:GNAT superfamily N-acetyltransferase [Mycolicibacterium sp. 624]
MQNRRVNDAPLFCGTALARRIESAEAQLIVAATEGVRSRGAAGLVMPVAGGFACFADNGSPMNKVVGLGFDGVPAGAAMDEVERTLFGHGVSVQVELSSLADPSVAALLSGRGYQLAGFKNVLGRSLQPGLEPAASSAIEARMSTDDELDAWVEVVVEGFAHPDGAGVPSHEDFPRDIVARVERDLEAAGLTAYVAFCDGVIAGGGGLCVTNGVAQLAATATAPAFRRRGVQSALMTVRLRDAAKAGCDIAVVTTDPGSTSQKNVQSKGFHLLYTRAVLAKAKD